MMSWLDNLMDLLAVGALGDDAQILRDRPDSTSDGAGGNTNGSGTGTDISKKDHSQPQLH
jgi:hypothetical protein